MPSLEDELRARPEFRGNLFRSYGPGKFDDYASAYLYELSLDGTADDEIGEGDTSYLLMRGPFEHPQLRQYRGAIMFENGQGFVGVEWFTSKKKLDSEWDRIAREIEEESVEEE
jgi:hypothetical protein